MKHAQYYRNIANGIARIAQAVKLCDLAPVETGTVFSKRFSLIKMLKQDARKFEIKKDSKISDAEWVRLIKNHLQAIHGSESHN